MGAGHGAPAAAATATDFGPAPGDLLGIIPSDNRVFLFSKSCLCELRAVGETLATRIFSLEPTCACQTGSFTFLIGFKNGTVSEFDSKFELLTTFCVPGGCRAHTGEVTSVASSSGCHLCSTGSDRNWRFWASNGSLLKTYPATTNLATCCLSPTYGWAADVRNRMYVVELADFRESPRVFALPSRALHICAIGPAAAFAALDDGSVALISTTDTAVQIQCRGQTTSCVSLLAVNEATGQLSYVAATRDGVLQLRMLEVVLQEIGEGRPFFAATPDEIIAVDGDRIVTMPRPALVAKTQKRLPEMELPRKAICEFFRTIQSASSPKQQEVAMF